MKEIAAIIFENDNGELLFYLRDNKPEIPFPGHWDLFGGHIEEGETPSEALVREIKEELDHNLTEFSFFRRYECLEGDAYPNIKHVFKGRFTIPVKEINLLEGDRPGYFRKSEIGDLRFANIIKEIVDDYLNDKSK